MTKVHKTDRSEHRPYIEEPQSGARRRRPVVYRTHTKNGDTEFMHSSSAEYFQPYEQSVAPQHQPRIAPFPQYWAPVPPQPVVSPVPPYVGSWPQVYPTSQLYGRSIPGRQPPTYVPPQHQAVYPQDGFHYARFVHQEPAAVRAPLVPQAFHQANFSTQDHGVNEWLDSLPNRDGFATQFPRYRQGYSEHSADSNFRRTEEPRYHRPEHHTLTPGQTNTDEPSEEAPEEAPPSYEDACAGHDQQYPQGPRVLRSPMRKRPRVRDATREDAMRHKIPPNYNLRQWDPDEQPFTVVGSAFDAYSLGEWIYGWSVHAYGKHAPETRASHHLWNLIIRVADKLRSSREFIAQSVGIKNMEQGENVDMVREFQEAGEHLMERFQEHLKKCERYVDESGNNDTGFISSDECVTFVKVLFRLEGIFENSASLTESMRLWNLRWGANCADVVGAEPNTGQPIDGNVDRIRESGN